MSLRNELPSYLDNIFPGSDIATEHSVLEPVHKRFELGGDHKTSTIARVDQATERAFPLFYDAFDKLKSLIWVLNYEYQDCHAFNTSYN